MIMLIMLRTFNLILTDSMTDSTDSASIDCILINTSLNGDASVLLVLLAFL